MVATVAASFVHTGAFHLVIALANRFGQSNPHPRVLHAPEVFFQVDLVFLRRVALHASCRRYLDLLRLYVSDVAVIASGAKQSNIIVN